jgi:hypothetical protein
MKRTILYLACLVAMISTSGIAGPQSEPLFSLRLAAPKQRIKPGAELHLFVTVKNTSDRNIKVVTSPGAVPEDWFRYKIRVTDAQGGTPPPAADVRNRDKRVGFYYGSTFARDLHPGESFVDQLTVTRLYDLTKPGKYSVSVARPIDAYNIGVEGVPPGKMPKGSIRSNTVTITVTE